MGKFNIFVHMLLLVIAPALYAQTSSIEQIVPETLDTLSYDDVVHLLDELESGQLEERCEIQELDRINQLLARLAKEGRLPTECAEELESDIAQLLHVSNSSYEYALCIGPDGAIYTYSIQNGRVILCGGWISKKWKETKEFCKKHKKTILIGTAIVVGAATAIITAGAASGTAVAAIAAAATAGANDTHASKHTIATPQIKSTIETKITSFKETLIAEDHLNSDLPIEENIRTLGSLFAHQSAQELQREFSNDPLLAERFETMRWYNSGFPEQFGHAGIDQKFSTDYASLYTPSQSDFNNMVHQTRGEKALKLGYYEQAVHDFSKVIDLNPVSPLTYLERGVAHFNLGQYEHSLSDYQQYIAQKPSPKEPFSLSSFSLGFAQSLPSGIYDSGEGTLLFLADLIKHPIHTSEQVWDSLVLLKDLVKTKNWEAIGETLSPQVHDLIINWDQFSSYERGKLAGYAFGRHSADFFLPAAAAKAAKTCKELITVSKQLQLAEKTLLLETAGAIHDGAKIIEANKQTIVLAEELGMSTSTTSQLKRAGALEKKQAAIMEQWTPEMRQSHQRFTEAEKLLKTRNRYMTEAEAREIIHQTGIRTFPRPAGIPENYRIKITNEGAGIKYVHPTNEETYVRVMPGKPYSEYLHQQKPYIVQMKNGNILNNSGQVVGKKAPEAHIPIEEYIFGIE